MYKLLDYEGKIAQSKVQTPENSYVILEYLRRAKHIIELLKMCVTSFLSLIVPKKLGQPCRLWKSNRPGPTGRQDRPRI